jgi:hypothetical protein
MHMFPFRTTRKFVRRRDMDIQQACLLTWRKFADRFDTKKWTPTRDEWLEHQTMERKVLAYTVLKYVPGVTEQDIHHCIQYAGTPFDAQDFIERLIPAISRAEEKAAKP